MDECETFGSEFCRNGQCLNTVPGYKCFCRTGYFYDAGRLECIGKMTSKSSSATLSGDTAELSLQGQIWPRSSTVILQGMGEVAGCIWAGNEPCCPCLPA